MRNSPEHGMLLIHVVELLTWCSSVFSPRSSSIPGGPWVCWMEGDGEFGVMCDIPKTIRGPGTEHAEIDPTPGIRHPKASRDWRPSPLSIQGG